MYREAVTFLYIKKEEGKGEIMIQPDLTSIAEKIVSQCARVKRGDCVFILARSDVAEFAEAIGIACTKKGAHPVVQSRSDNYRRENLLKADLETLGTTPRHFLALIKETDVFFQVGFLLANPGFLRDVPEERFVAHSKGHKPVQELLYDGTRKWIGIACPTPGQAEAFQIPWESYHDSLWKALDADYGNLLQRCKRLEEVLKGKKEVRITSKKGTDVNLDIEGAPLLCDGGVISEPGEGFPLLNLPSGEVYLPPMNAEGSVVFDYAFLQGTRIIDLKGEFTEGILEFTGAESGFDSVRKALEPATGDQMRIAELGIGVNPDLTQHGNVIATEKMNGSVHLAIGENRPIGGTNVASGHWDMFIFEPTVAADEFVIIRDGKFQIEGLS